MNNDINSYIAEARRKGMSDEGIRSVLLNLGYPPEDITAALGGTGGGPVGATPARPAPDLSPAMPAAATTVPNTVHPAVVNPAVPAGAVDEAYVSRWSWGGFGLVGIYFLGSRLYKTGFLYLLGMFVPFLNIWLWIKSGLRGRRIVWASGEWTDFAAYRKRQHVLDIIGIVLLCLSLASGFFAAFSVTAMLATPGLNDHGSGGIHYLDAGGTASNPVE
jgi:hypothetical protein